MTDDQMTDDQMTDAVPATGRTETEVRRVVRRIIVELGPEGTDPADDATTLIEGMGYNSLALIELAFTLEDEFDLAPIDEVTARRIGTLQAVQDHVVAELTGRGELAATG